jgi:putative membrane protein
MGTLAVTVIAALSATLVATGSPPAPQHTANQPTATWALDDPTIVAIFDAANTWDIESAGLGAQKSHTSDVVNLAQMFVRDHKQVRQQGRDLAKKLGVTPTPPKDFPLAKTHQEAMAKLQKLSGPEFDRAFLQNEADYHKAVIDAINTTLLPSIQNAELKALVERVAPAFQAHMIAAQQLLDRQHA